MAERPNARGGEGETRRGGDLTRSQAPPGNPGAAGRGSASRTTTRHTIHSEHTMPKYVIERELPGAGQLTPEQLKSISQTSCRVLQGLGPQIQWVQSFVTDDKIYCVYIAPNKQLVEEHARQGGFPANRI